MRSHRVSDGNLLGDRISRSSFWMLTEYIIVGIENPR
jgi:hypothetical protein